jgi:diguanylate cyclase
MLPSFNLTALLSPLMLIAWAMAPLSAYVAMDLLVRVRTDAPGRAARWQAGAALCLGTGAWSVQVIALSAQALPFAVGHAPVGVVLAWLLALVGRRLAGLRALVGALIFGLSVLGTQAVLLWSAGLRPGLAWQPVPVVLALATVAAGTAWSLWLAIRWRPKLPAMRLLRDLSASLLCGLPLVLAQQLVYSGVNLSSQAGSAYATLLSLSAMTLLATVGAFALLLAVLLSSKLEARMRASLLKTRGELEQTSLRDSLTRLPNRLRFEGTLAQAVQQADQRRGRLALMFINIDGFKLVNEAGGHRLGDRLLCEMAGRLRSAAKAHMVARVGGDEFVLLMTEDPQRANVSDQAGRLLAMLAVPFRLDHQDHAVTCSIGVAMYPEDGALSTLISHAGLAMRECKAAGGGSHCFFEARMVSGAREQAELLRDLRLAQSRKELELYYQPKIHAPTGEITGAEALLRWNHPNRGLVSPAVFIPIAERFGLIKPIGQWVIDEACRQIRAWRDEGLRMRVAINLSPYQLRDPTLGPHIDAALKKQQINPKLLTCEITESVAMEDSAATMKFFAVLAGVGVHISIDDFGTGYSSLSYLRKLPAEELKIDSSFVCDLESSKDARAVVDAVVKLGQALNLKVVAEGVETEAQNQILRSLGCNELQGFLFAKPMAAKALGLWAMNDVGPRSIMFRPSLFQPTAPSPIH